MSLELDKRQRAMLREMGLQVWAPLAEVAQAPVQEPSTLAAAAARPSPSVNASSGAPANALVSAPASAPVSASSGPASRPSSAAASSPAARPGLPPGLVPASSLAPAAPRSATPARARAAAPLADAPAAAPAETGGHTWQVSEPMQVVGQNDATAEQGQRWLLVAEGRFDELTDGAGQLLQNMLKAAKLHQGAQVWMAPMQRTPGPTQVRGLDEVLARIEPDVIFIMSRLGAQALLETTEPLGRLRGQVHDLWGQPAIVSYDLGALMRTPTEKAKAWDDLCLALQVARAQHAQRMEAE